jgi:hypothetical protein
MIAAEREASNATNGVVRVKRPRNAYSLYVKKRGPEVKESHSRLSYAERVKVMAGGWQGLSDAEKAPFQNAAAAELERYDRATEYAPSGSDEDEVSAL